MFRLRTRATKERRRHPRKAAIWTGYVEIDPTGHPVQFTLADISQGGALLELAAETVIQPGDHLMLTVERMGKTPVLFTLSGTAQRVVHTPSGPRIAIELRGPQRTKTNPLSSILDDDG